MPDTSIKGLQGQVSPRGPRYFTFEGAAGDRVAEQSAQPAPPRPAQAYHTRLGYTSKVNPSRRRLEQSSPESLPRRAGLPLAKARQLESVPARLPPPSVDCGVWKPFKVEHGPSARYSPEFVPFTTGKWNSAHTGEVPGLALVRQSEGGISQDKPLVSIKFDLCTAFLLRNAATGETLLVHYDSGVRSTWRPESLEEQGPSVEPATPGKGIMRRDRIAYVDFMSRTGRKQVLQVQGDAAYDRRELETTFTDAGIELLAPLIMQTEPMEIDRKVAEWHLCYRPLSDELVIQLTNTAPPHVMHFRDVFAHPPAAAPRPQGYVPDFVDRLAEHRERVRTSAGISDYTQRVLTLCLAVVDLRNVNGMLAGEKFFELYRKCPHLFPQKLIECVESEEGLPMCSPMVTRVLTRIADILIEQDRRELAAAEVDDESALPG